jgi:hypothetical protein
MRSHVKVSHVGTLRGSAGGASETLLTDPLPGEHDPAMIEAAATATSIAKRREELAKALRRWTAARCRFTTSITFGSVWAPPPSHTFRRQTQLAPGALSRSPIPTVPNPRREAPPRLDRLAPTVCLPSTQAHLRTPTPVPRSRPRQQGVHCEHLSAQS